MRKYSLALLITLILVIIAAVVAQSGSARPLLPLLNAVLMMGIPLGLGVYLARRLNVEWGLYGAGMLTFIASQVLHIPFNAYLLNPLVERWGLTPEPGSLELILFGILFGLSAGVFEESARYLVYRRWLPKARSWNVGVMFGAGHGGVESILFGGLAFYAFLQLLALRNADLNVVLPPGQIAPISVTLEAFWNTTWYMYFMGAVERLSAICFHLSASLLVLQAFTRRNLLWFVLAVLWHTVLDALAVYGSQTWGILATEGIICLVALTSIGIIFALRKVEEQVIPEQAVQPPPPLLPIQDEANEITLEKLEDSRYD
jgi:uncharacterized membrane protein YhfC